MDKLIENKNIIIKTINDVNRKYFDNGCALKNLKIIKIKNNDEINNDYLIKSINDYLLLNFDILEYEYIIFKTKDFNIVKLLQYKLIISKKWYKLIIYKTNDRFYNDIEKYINKGNNILFGLMFNELNLDTIKIINNKWNVIKIYIKKSLIIYPIDYKCKINIFDNEGLLNLSKYFSGLKLIHKKLLNLKGVHIHIINVNDFDFKLFTANYDQFENNCIDLGRIHINFKKSYINFIDIFKKINSETVELNFSIKIKDTYLLFSLLFEFLQQQNLRFLKNNYYYRFYLNIKKYVNTVNINMRLYYNYYNKELCENFISITFKNFNFLDDNNLLKYINFINTFSTMRYKSKNYKINFNKCNFNMDILTLKQEVIQKLTNFNLDLRKIILNDNIIITRSYYKN